MRLKQKYKYKNVYEFLKGMFYFNVSLRILRGFKLNLKVVLKGVKDVLIYDYRRFYSLSSVERYIDFDIVKCH